MDRSSIFTWVGLSLALLGTILTFSWNGIFNFIIAKVSLELCTASIFREKEWF
jgi:hypothetical protein